MIKRRRNAIAVAGFMTSLLACAALGGPPDSTWLDPRMPDEERELLAETEGHCLPPLDQVTWVGDAPAAGDLEGKIVVIQSWTRASQRGRAVIRRVENLIKRSGHGDDVTLITLHVPEEADGAAAFIKRRKPNGFAAIDNDGAVCDALGVWKRPTTIVVDRSGTIRAAGVNLVRMDKVIQAIAEEASPELGPELPSRAERDDASGRSRIETPSFPPVRGSISNGADLRGKQGPELHVDTWISKPPVLTDKVLMVEFWATWCGPCIRNIPHLNELADKHREHLVVVGISDEPVATIRKFMRQKRMSYHVGSDQSRNMARVTKHRGIPFAIIMSPDGIVRWQGHPGRLTDDTIEQIIKASGLGREDPSLPPYRWSADEVD